MPPSRTTALLPPFLIWTLAHEALHIAKKHDAERTRCCVRTSKVYEGLEECAVERFTRRLRRRVKGKIPLIQKPGQLQGRSRHRIVVQLSLLFAEGELCFKRATPLLENDTVRGGEPYRILVVDDFECFRRFVNSALRRRTGFQVVEASDGLAAVQKAERLKPDVILLDIGLPNLNGLEVARRIREFDPSARILFLSHESSAEVIQEALGLGATGYVHKPSAQRDLLPAIEAVLKGQQFVSNGLKFRESANPPHRHEIIFSSEDELLLNGLVRFVAAALNAGDGAIVWATEPHRADIRQRLYGQGVDVDSAIQRGTYITSDVSEPPDPQRILASIKGVSEAAFRMGRRHPRVSVCGERAGRLWAEGKTDTALRIEKLFNN